MIRCWKISICRSGGDEPRLNPISGFAPSMPARAAASGKTCAMIAFTIPSQNTNFSGVRSANFSSSSKISIDSFRVEGPVGLGIKISVFSPADSEGGSANCCPAYSGPMYPARFRLLIMIFSASGFPGSTSISISSARNASIRTKCAFSM